MKKNYLSPTVEIEETSDLITTSSEVETDRMPFGATQEPTGISGFTSSTDFFNI